MHLPFAEEEYFGEMRGDVVRFSRLMVDVGADWSSGWPHVVRAMESTRTRLIATALEVRNLLRCSVASKFNKGVAQSLSLRLTATANSRPDSFDNSTGRLGPSMNPAK
jgi:hypothetical protein